MNLKDHKQFRLEESVIVFQKLDGVIKFKLRDNSLTRIVN